MTIESARTIAWDIPTFRSDNVRPGADCLDFASWLTRQDTASTSELDRLNNLTQLLYHVSEKLSPSKHMAKGPCMHRIAAAYKDKRIVQELSRWAGSLDWTENRHAYVRTINTLLSPLATPLVSQCCKEHPRFRFGLQLAYAFHHDGVLNEANVQSKAIEEGVKHLIALGLTEAEQATKENSTVLLCLTRASLTGIAPDLRPHIDVFKSLYDPSAMPPHRLNSKQGLHLFNSALFDHLMQVHASPQMTDNLSLPENAFDMV